MFPPYETPSGSPNSAARQASQPRTAARKELLIIFSQQTNIFKVPSSLINIKRKTRANVANSERVRRRRMSRGMRSERTLEGT